MIKEIRTFTLSDRENIIGIFNSNCPKYFDKKDLQDLIDFLDNYADDNFKVILHNNEVIGCGGHYVKQKEKVFGIAIDISKETTNYSTLFFDIRKSIYKEVSLGFRYQWGLNSMFEKIDSKVSHFSFNVFLLLKGKRNQEYDK